MKLRSIFGHKLTSLFLTSAPPTQVNKHSQLPRPVPAARLVTWHIHLTLGAMYACDHEQDALAAPYGSRFYCPLTKVGSVIVT